MIEHQHLKEGSKDEYETVLEDTTLNSMVPLWKKSAGSVTQEEYNAFYQEKFGDYEPPLTVIVPPLLSTTYQEFPPLSAVLLPFSSDRVSVPPFIMTVPPLTKAPFPWLTLSTVPLP